MKVEIIDRSMTPMTTCGEAAAICTDFDDYNKALAGAMSSGHESVVEHAYFTFLIEGVSRALLAQLTRHRLASFSVQSQRYVSMKGGFPFIIPPSITALGPEAVARFCTQMTLFSNWYDEWGKLIPGEDARFVLPNACETKLVMTMNARELRHFFSLRTCNRAQWEIRALADEMLELCRAEAPALFKDAGCACMAGKPCPEGKRSCGRPRTNGRC